MITPQESYHDLAQNLGLSSVFLKREDLHPYGSHKGRSIPLMIDKYISQGYKHFAISSSGNAALAAGLYIKKLNGNGGNNLKKKKGEEKTGDKKKDDSKKITLEIFAGKKINENKLKKLEALKDNNIFLSLQDRPLQALFIKIQNSSPEQPICSLRQSNDDTALEGYNSLAEELLCIPNLKAVFVGTSSGTTAQAFAEYFSKNKKKVEMHIVQTSSCHPIADAFINNNKNDERSIADAIVDHTAIRKDKLVSLIKENGGNAYAVNNEEIKMAQKLSEKYTGVSISTNSALSLAGLMQAVYTGKKWKGAVACLICGD